VSRGGIFEGTVARETRGQTSDNWNGRVQRQNVTFWISFYRSTGSLPTAILPNISLTIEFKVHSEYRMFLETGFASSQTSD
jgi:hypothetical protein